MDIDIVSSKRGDCNIFPKVFQPAVKAEMTCDHGTVSTFKLAPISWKATILFLAFSYFLLMFLKIFASF